MQLAYVHYISMCNAYTTYAYVAIEPNKMCSEMWKATIFLIQGQTSSVSTGNLHLNRAPRSKVWTCQLPIWPGLCP